MVNDFSLILRVYLSNGDITFNDERTNKVASVNYKCRSHVLMVFIILIILTFPLEHLIKFNFSPRLVLTYLYLGIDVFFMTTSTKLFDTSNAVPFYMDIKLYKKISFIGIFNSFCLFVFSAYFFKNI